MLWKEDLEGRKVLVSLGGRDLIVNTEAVGRYLTGADQPPAKLILDGTDEEWKSRPWREEGVNLLWWQTLDHAQVFDKPGSRKMLVSAIRGYCNKGI